MQCYGCKSIVTEAYEAPYFYNGSLTNAGFVWVCQGCKDRGAFANVGDVLMVSSIRTLAEERAREAELTSFYEREEGYHDDEQALIEDDHFKTHGF